MFDLGILENSGGYDFPSSIYALTLKLLDSEIYDRYLYEKLLGKLIQHKLNL